MKVSIFEDLHKNNFRNWIQTNFSHNVKSFELKIWYRKLFPIRSGE